MFLHKIPLFWAVLVAVACQGPAQTPSPSAEPALLRTAATPYERKSWRHWIDADRDCQNTRTEVLIQESEVPVEFADARRCKIKRGRWTCPYTGVVVMDPARLDVDHLVPLENAHRSGGEPWSQKKKELYANDLTHADHLIAVLSAANRAKGSKAPGEWLPPNTAHVCAYVARWKQVKEHWSLSMTPRERRKIDENLARCGTTGKQRVDLSKSTPRELK